MPSALIQPLSPAVEQLASGIVDSAFPVHKGLGPGLLESIYETCFCHELSKRGIPFKRQIAVPLVYDELRFEDGLRVDVLVDDLVICELKAVEILLPVHQAQLLTYLKLTRKRLGFFINFNVPTIKHGIRRLVL
jgi:GxxExxY protein